MDELTNTIHACIAANVPSVALSTTETDTVIQEIARSMLQSILTSLKGQQKRRRVLVWRESVGFEDGVFTKVDGVKSQVEILIVALLTLLLKESKILLVTEGTGRNLTSHINQRI